jgi:DNA-binding transcriptional LysR family regulator
MGVTSLRGIDTNLVVALHALLTHQNVTRAAKAMGLSQSSMSHTLARLRSHFDDPLLIPAGRKLMLSERAKTLVGPVNTVIAQLEAVFRPPAPFNPKTSERAFHITATDNLELYVLPRLAKRLQESAPKVDLRVTALPLDWTAALEQGDIDLKLGRKSDVRGNLESQELSVEDFACVVREGHPVRSRPTLAQFAALDHILVAPTAPPSTRPSGTIDAILAKHKLARRIVMTVPHFLVAPFIVAASNAVLTAPARLLGPFVELLGLRTLPLPVTMPRYMLAQVWAARSTSDPGHEWLRNEVASIFGT